ncbi:hypothetical protein BCV71DRAFT_270631 [Rhizopus microsporus]|uniref:Uncharacterized protein n=1 Tax=Rhizopus microsporus TaxID=58291 RepID=A0A1X0RYL8_RHIZD|nr:hypothetical protein BCV71DRAFT_270631 [Rhizopus microsporus]
MSEQPSQHDSQTTKPTASKEQLKTVNKNKDQLYVITPQTTLMTISQHNRIVYIVDLSSSLATIGDSQCNILLSEVYQTQIISLKNFPSFDRPSEQQSLLIIHSLLQILRAEFIAFQEDIAAFRRFIREHRINMDYDLDVGSKTDPAPPDVLNATSFSLKGDINKGKPNELHVDAAIEKDKDTGYHSSKKEVWGVGKSGASLSRILHAGHFALKLLPREGSSHLVLITDGAMKSNIHDNTFVRQFAEEDINCHVIQVGSKSGFIPGKNFGFVPDTEVLKFLARATSGSFLYSEKCVPVASASREATEPLQENNQAVVQVVGINQLKQIVNPNIYHYHFLFREATFSKIGNEARLAENDSRMYLSRRNLDGEHIEWPLNFPWDPNAKSPEEECRLLKYKEYSLPSEFSHIVAARAREGFSIQSVTFDDGSGTRVLDPGIHELEAKNLSSVRKERVQMLMTMHWQPNVVIEYRIRATWLPVIIGNATSYNNETLLMSSGLFYRAKAPRAEILVRTDASFAHMLQNWDVFKRRAQMMGVVTGYIYFGETYAAPVYSKIEKLKNYLIDIYEGDETLRSIIGFPNKFWVNLTAAEPMTSPSRIDSPSYAARHVYMQHQEMYINSFKSIWNRMNAADTRARTRCWYDPECIDLLIGDVSPFMDPKLLSPYNQEFIYNAQENITAMLENVRTVLKEWADFEGDDGTLVKMLHRNLPTTITGHDDIIKEPFAPSPFKLSPSFCELRIRHEYGRLITLRLLFFNTEVSARRRVREHLLYLLKTSPLTAFPYNIVCQRPFSSLLMRDSKHFSDSYPNVQNGKTLGNMTKHQSRGRTWYLPFATWLTSEYIVRDYLHHITWTWQTNSYDDTYHRNNKMMPIHDLAFQFLCQTRLDQGYQLVSPRPDSTQFYQEITLPAATGNRTCRCAVQYFIWKDSATGKITTELWMEPAGEFDTSQYDRIKSWAFEPDRRKISELVTFDQIHAVGRSRGIGELREKRKNSQTVDGQEEKDNVMLLSQLFDVALVLRSNRFVIASFKSPVFEKSAHLQQIRLQLMLPQSSDKIPDGSSTTTANSPAVKNKSLIKTHRYFRRTANSSSADLVAHSSVPLEDQNSLLLKPDPLLLKSAKTIVKLSSVLQNYSILHYFVERSLEYVSNGEINMANHDLGTSFWNELKTALKKVCDYQKTSSTSLVSDLRKTRCFVKVFDPRSFVIILFPSLECASSSLLKLQTDDPSDELVSGPPISYHLDVFMFECTRQKPMKPVKETSTHGTPNLFSEEDLTDDLDNVTIQPIEYLIHEFDGVGRTLRPTFYRGYFSSCQSNAQLTERVLRVAQDIARSYSKSFFNSLYSCLLKGFLVDDNDLDKVLEVCNESSMEIDITEFVNIMALQDKDSAGLDVQMSEAQGKFNAIFNQYFQPVHTKNKSANLFYFKSLTNKYNTVFDFEDTSEDSKVFSLLNLAAHSRSPLLVKLFCVSRTIETDSADGRPRKVERSVPVNTLPTLDMDIFEKNSVLDGSTPDGFFTSKSEVLLQLVFLSMPKTELEKNDSKDNDILPAGIE